MLFVFLQLPEAACLARLGLQVHRSMVVVGRHFAFLLLVAQWLKSNRLTAKIWRFLLPKPNVNQARTRISSLGSQG